METKYGKYIITDPTRIQSGAEVNHSKKEGEYSRFLGFLNKDLMAEAPLYCNVVRISDPPTQPTLYKSVHVHEVEEVLLFLSIGPDCELGGEVVIHLGSEGEKHAFSRNTLVYIPKLMKHCPVYFNNFKKDNQFFIISFYFSLNVTN